MVDKARMLCSILGTLRSRGRGYPRGLWASFWRARRDGWMDCSAGRGGIGGLAAALLGVGPSEKNSIECKYKEDCINYDDEEVKVFISVALHWLIFNGRARYLTFYIPLSNPERFHHLNPFPLCPVRHPLHFLKHTLPFLLRHKHRRNAKPPTPSQAIK